MFLQKTLQILRSFFQGGYKKLPKSLSLKPFSCTSCNKRRDLLYSDFYDALEADLNSVIKKQNDDSMLIVVSKEAAMKEDRADISSGSFINLGKTSPAKSKQEGRLKEKNPGGSQSGSRGNGCSQNRNRGNHALVKKMKQLDMMNATDVEQVLDIEEALHYYSRLRSPVYLDIVDKFFMDMNSDYCVPQATLTDGDSNIITSAKSWLHQDIE